MRLFLLSLAVGAIFARFSPHIPVVSDNLLVKDAPGAPPRPVPPQNFTSSVIFHTTASYGYGLMQYDLANHRQNITVREPSVIGNWTIDFREIALPASFWIIMNDRCQSVPDATFGDLFSWVRVANYLGSVTLPPLYNNRTCDLWNYFAQNQVNLSLCVQQNTPVLLEIVNMQDQTHGETIYFGTDYTPGPPPASVFVLPDQCGRPDPLCPNGASSQLDAFIFHPAHMFDLNNENVADLLGDTVFICADALSNHTEVDQFQWVSRYTLQLWNGWGQYAECNRPTPNASGECIGSETFAVGREAAFAVKENCGQCTDNSDVGSWFSLPTGGMCNSTTQPLGQDASKGECTWRILQRVKTIDGKCLLKTNDLLGACIKDGNYPFATSQAVLLQSFESSDPSKGGCPPIS